MNPNNAINNQNNIEIRQPLNFSQHLYDYSLIDNRSNYSYNANNSQQVNNNSFQNNLTTSSSLTNVNYFPQTTSPGNEELNQFSTQVNNQNYNQNHEVYTTSKIPNNLTMNTGAGADYYQNINPYVISAPQNIIFQHQTEEGNIIRVKEEQDHRGGVPFLGKRNKDYEYYKKKNNNAINKNCPMGINSQSSVNVNNGESVSTENSFVENINAPPEGENNNLINMNLGDFSQFSTKPVFSPCPKCKMLGFTEVKKKMSVNNLACCLVFSTLPWLFYQVLRGKELSCYNADHYCSNCKQMIAEYDAC